MMTDYLDAFERHAVDAETLFQASRWANADHLFGLATECGLKRLMLAFRMPWDSTKESPRKSEDKKHVDAVWDRYEHYRAGYGNANYVLLSPNPFSNWDASQRYAAQSNFDIARVVPHQSACDDVRKLLKQALLEGIIQ